MPHEDGLLCMIQHAEFFKIGLQLKNIFLNTFQLQKCSCKKIEEFLVIPTMKTQLIFIKTSAQVFTKYTSSMQKEEPLVHVMYDELNNLLCNLMGRICKIEHIPKTFSNNFGDELFNQDKMVPLKDIIINDSIREEFHIKNLKEKDILSFLYEVQQHYIAACKHILITSPINNVLLKNLRCLSPTERFKSRSCNDILKLAIAVPFDIQNDLLLDEWKLLQQEKDVKENISIRIDTYWQTFFIQTNATGNLKYPCVTKIVKSCLSLVHGSADVERNFSTSGKMLTDERSSMGERILNALLTTKDSLKHYYNKPHQVFITKKLITMAKGAHKHYTNYLEEQKFIKEKNKQIEKQKEQQKQKLEEIQNNMEYRKQRIQKQEQLLKSVREEEGCKR